MSKLHEIKREYGANYDILSGIGWSENVEWLIEQVEKVKKYEEYFEENSVESIEKKMQPYYEELAKFNIRSL